MQNLEREADARIISSGYKNLLDDLKEKVKVSQLKAAISINNELIKLYWDIGNKIFEKQEKEGWGAKTIEKLAKDLKNYFTNMKGFSFTNLKYMVQFAKAYPDIAISQQAVGQIPWGHNIIIMQKIENDKERLWYAEQTIQNGWSRNMLETWIDSRLYQRKGKAITNFKATLPKSQSDLANQTLKDPYNFDFLTLIKKHDEHELEDSLLKHIEQFLVELGDGFSFAGRQYHIKVDNKDYYIDILFYHLKLRCSCVIELKSVEFKPEYAGKMNFYLSAVDDLLRHSDDKPTIGMIFCKTKNRFTVEYALRDINKPIGVSGYETKIVESLPENLKGSLPSIEDLELEFSKNVEKDKEE